MGTADPSARTGDDRDAALEAVRAHSHPALSVLLTRGGCLVPRRRCGDAEC